MIASGALARPSLRFGIAVAVAVAAGIAIGVMDSRPGFDDTGITVVGLFLAGAMTAALGGSRAWLFAILVGSWVPLFEVPAGGGTAPLFALVVAGVGALVGGGLTRLSTSGV